MAPIEIDEEWRITFMKVREHVKKLAFLAKA